IPAGIDNNETHSGGGAGGLGHMSEVDALAAIKPERHLTEGVFSNPGYKTDLRSQPCATHGLIGTFAAKVHAITGAQHCLARTGQTLDSHSQPRGITTHNSDSRSVQEGNLHHDCRKRRKPTTERDALTDSRS